MKKKKGLLALLMVILCSCALADQPINKSDAEKSPQQKSIMKNIDFPNFEKSADEVEQNIDNVLKMANEKLDEIVSIPLADVTFENSILVYEKVLYDVSVILDRIDLLAAVSKDKALRDMASDKSVELQKWFIELTTRKDIYDTFKTLKDKKIKLKGPDQKLFEETLLEYERMGFGLPKEKQEKVKSLLKEVTEITQEIDENINKSNNYAILLTEEEVKGMDPEILETFEKDEEGRYKVIAGIAHHITQITTYCPNEETRKKVIRERLNRVNQNGPLAKKVVLKRAEIANLLGYNNWADYQTETKMVKTGTNAKNFIEEMSKRVDSKFQEELSSLQLIKAKETGKKVAAINNWDVDYYQRIYKEQEFNLNMEGLKKYFKLENVLNGMFRAYETSFGLKIEYIDAPYVWDEEVKVIQVLDAKTKALQGILYLDLYPRPEHEKYGHFAEFSVRPGRLMEDGTFRHPVASLVCNFPKPTEDKPSLLTYDQVNTVFHEFGHGLHELLSKAKYASQAGTRVARDFVETPSQVLEYWTSDPGVLSLFAVNYMDPNDKLSKETVEAIKKSENATIATHYKRQFSFGLADLKIHSLKHGEDMDPVAVTNETVAEVYLPYPGEGFLNTFGHLFHGYDAGYYGYAWADSIAADFASKFEGVKDGFLNKKIGMKLRKEVFEKGGSRDENISATKFLGRKPNNDAFVKKLLGK